MHLLESNACSLYASSLLMTTDQTSHRINQLEILFTEQEYTIETLNSVVTRQAQDLDLLTTQVELLKLQLKDLKTNITDNDTLDERPPHY